MTIPGTGIFIGPDNRNNTDLLRHEFGHVLQYRKWGSKVFWGCIVPGSLESANKSNDDPKFIHMNTWTEWSANYLSYKYFGQPADWNFNNYPIWPTTLRPGSVPPFGEGPLGFKFKWLDN